MFDATVAVLALCACFTQPGAQGPGKEDPAIDSVVALVRRVHPAVAAARAQVRASEMLSRSAAGVRPAELVVAIEEGATQVQAGIQGEVFAGARRDARRRAAESDASAERARLLIAERALDFQTRIRVTRWLAGLEVAARLGAQDSLWQDAEETIAARFSAGATGYVDVLRVRAERLRLQTERAAGAGEAEQQRLAILDALAVDSAALRAGSDLLGRLAATAPSRFDPILLPELPPEWADSARATMMPLVTALIEQGQRLQKLAEAETSTALTGAVGVQRFPDALDRARIGATVGFSASLPFSARGQNASSREAARARAAALESESRALGATAERHFTRLREQYGVERTIAQAHQRALLADLRSEREAIFAAYRNGSMALLELLEFERTMLRAEISQIESVEIAMVTWYRLASRVPQDLAVELGFGGIP